MDGSLSPEDGHVFEGFAVRWINVDDDVPGVPQLSGVLRHGRG